MAAVNSEAMRSAVVTMEELTADEKVRLQCEARERYETDIRTWKSLIQEAEEKAQKAEAETQTANAKAQTAEAKLRGVKHLLEQNPSASAEEILKALKF